MGFLFLRSDRLRFAISLQQYSRGILHVAAAGAATAVIFSSLFAAPVHIDGSQQVVVR